MAWPDRASVASSAGSSGQHKVLRHVGRDAGCMALANYHRWVIESMSLAARLCWRLHARQGVLSGAEIAAAFLFVMGCITFYVPSQYTVGVSLFLLGSLLMLFSVTGRAFLRYGPSR